MSMIKVGNIFLIGPMGAGKSTIGRALAKELKLEFYDSDEAIEDRAGVDIAWIFDVEGEDGFRIREARVIDDLTQLNNIVLATGGGAIITAENRVALASRGTVVYLKTSLESQYQRTRRDAKRPLLQTEDVTGKIEELWEEREPLYRELADLSFDTDQLSVKAVANKIIEHITGNNT